MRRWGRVVGWAVGRGGASTCAKISSECIDVLWLQPTPVHLSSGDVITVWYEPARSHSFVNPSEPFDVAVSRSRLTPSGSGRCVATHSGARQRAQMKFSGAAPGISRQSTTRRELSATMCSSAEGQ